MSLRMESNELLLRVANSHSLRHTTLAYLGLLFSKASSPNELPFSSQMTSSNTNYSSSFTKGAINDPLIHLVDCLGESNFKSVCFLTLTYCPDLSLTGL